MLSAGLSARERNRLKRLAKQNQKRGGPADALPAAKRAKADANGSSTVRHYKLRFSLIASCRWARILLCCFHQHEQEWSGCLQQRVGMLAKPLHIALRDTNPFPC